MRRGGHRRFREVLRDVVNICSLPTGKGNGGRLAGLPQTSLQVL